MKNIVMQVVITIVILILSYFLIDSIAIEKAMFLKAQNVD